MQSGRIEDMEIEDKQQQDVVYNEEDEPEVGNTETDTTIEDSDSESILNGTINTN